LHRQCHLERHAGGVSLAAAYTATKQAIEGFTASLAHELAISAFAPNSLPGYAPTTRFGANAIVPVSDLLPGDYADFARPILEALPPRR
jgi:NAD(P)-dependent dehydrogenase (short-subunit alcohol dehydrogenase family)